MNHTIVLVEDDKTMRDYLVQFFQDANFRVTAFENGLDALEHLEEKRPHVVILDLGLPDISGETVLKEVRKTHPDLPVILLTARDQVSDITQGLNMGADDYLPKPFNAQELLARVKARLRNANELNKILKVRDITINLDTREVTQNEEVLDLTKTEFDLLHLLVKNTGKILTREIILNHVWEYNADIETRVVDVYVGYLRKKIETDPEKPLIHTKRGIGYYIKNQTDTN